MEFMMENDQVPNRSHPLSWRLILPKRQIKVPVEIGNPSEFG
jgi:hypothetical protein